MKKFFRIIILLAALSLTSCMTRVVDAQKPLRDNSIELYQKYRIQKTDASFVKAEVVKIDPENLYVKTTTGEMITIPKSEIYEIKKLDLLSSIAIGAAAILAVIFVPI